MSEHLTDISTASYKSLARTISIVENAAEGYNNILLNLPSNSSSFIIGITGPPGAGKSTIVDALIEELISADKKVGVLCIDPSSPFNLGALLGDRIRMNQWYTHPNVFIRSLASRGSLGGLHPSIIEITDVMKAFGFDYIIVETVGVGQSEVEIAGLADTTVVVLVPEGGDEVQTMKAGLMEIGDIFVVNKSDRPNADHLVQSLRQMLAPAQDNSAWKIPVIKTSAVEKTGIKDLVTCIEEHHQQHILSGKKFWLLAEKAYQVIQKNRMMNVDKAVLKNRLEKAYKQPDFNLYSFINDQGLSKI